MVKRRESFEKILYKNSKTTFRTHSKCSSVSLYSDSLVLLLKKRQPKDYYYKSNGKLKRDLSIATDFCILRNYCKKNRHKFNVKRDKKTGYNETEVLSVNEYIEHDYDSFEDILKTRVNFDLTTLIVDNLKSLVSDWIRKHLLDSDETKEKVENIVNTILHRLDVKSKTSSCTYAIDVLVDPNLNDLSAMRNAKTATIKHNIGSITSMIALPLNDNNFKIVSTLSVPRHLMKQKIKKNINRGNGDSIDMHQSVTKASMCSFEHEKRKSAETHKIDTNKSSQDRTNLEKYKNLTVNKTEVKKLTYHQISSIYKDFAYNDIMNLENVENVGGLEVKTEMKLNKSEPSDCIKQMTNKKVNTRYTKHHKKTNYRDKINRHSNALYNNLKHKTAKNDIIIKCMKDIFDYILFIKEIDKLKLNISINVLPVGEQEKNKDEKYFENKPSKCCTHAPTSSKLLTRDLLEKTHINKSQQLFFTTKRDILSSNMKLMSLLDAESKQKIFASDNNFINTDTNYINKLVNKDVVNTNGREIATEIRELKEIIRSLALTAKDMLSTHLTAVRKKYKDLNKGTNLREKENVTKESTTEGIHQMQSKSVQISESFTKDVNASKVDKHKVPEVSTSIFDRNIYKKSMSYRLFDSETILRVTDMTSGANTLVEKYSNMYETSTQLSRSSVDSTANRSKLYAYYCDSMKRDENYQPFIPPYYSSKIYYVLSEIKDSDILNTAVTSKDSRKIKRDPDVEKTTVERKKRICDCFHTNFQRKFTLTMFFVVPFIIVMSLVYLYLRGQFAFKPSPSVFPMLMDKKPINVSELGFR